MKKSDSVWAVVVGDSFPKETAVEIQILPTLLQGGNLVSIAQMERDQALALAYPKPNTRYHMTPELDSPALYGLCFRHIVLFFASDRESVSSWAYAWHDREARRLYAPNDSEKPACFRFGGELAILNGFPWYWLASSIAFSSKFPPPGLGQAGPVGSGRKDPAPSPDGLGAPH